MRCENCNNDDILIKRWIPINKTTVNTQSLEYDTKEIWCNNCNEHVSLTQDEDCEDEDCEDEDCDCEND